MGKTTTQGIKLLMGQGDVDPGPETFNAIAEVTNLSGPGKSAPQVDASSFDSTAREYLGGLPDGGEVTFDVNLIGDDIQHQALFSGVGTVKNFKVLLNDATLDASKSTYAFSAVITNFSGPQAGGLDQMVTASITLKVTGDVTFTPAA